MTDFDPPDVLSIDECVGERYDVLRRIGHHGGMAQVYQVFDRTHSCERALKICENDGETFRFFRREIRSMHAIVDEHVMPILDGGEYNGMPFLVMPLAQRSLAELKFDCNDRDDVQALLGIFIQACEGVAAIHSEGWVHRDIKPHNILQVEDTWVISDFGLSKAVRRANPALTTIFKTRTGTTIGTEAYMAPEQRRGDAAAVNERTDIFQLGLVLWYMLTGEDPVHFDFSEIPCEEIRPVVQKCVKRAPEERYSSVAELIRDTKVVLASYEAMPVEDAPSESGPDTVSWLDLPCFAGTCKNAYRRRYLQVRHSDAWPRVHSQVDAYSMALFSCFDEAFIAKESPQGYMPGAGPKSGDSIELAGFEATEQEIIRWLSFRRLVLAAGKKYHTIAADNIDALLVLFLNYVPLEDVTQEFMDMRGWLQHVVRIRPWLTKIGIKPTELASGIENVLTLGEYERIWLESLEFDDSFPSWWPED